jgi:maltose alpha-D-glucosyltransferase / alpha-amylase
LALALQRRPAAHPHSQYGVFLRNHDELDLERLTSREREEVLERFAPDEDMRAYGRGIRRRLAPMLDGDTRRIAMAHALLMSLPGTPVLLYGDEIGMGEDLSRPERKAVRSLMQWSAGDSGGFSLAPADQLAAPVISGGKFGYEQVNVADQTQQRDSLLAIIGNLVRSRIGAEEIGAGEARVLDAGHASVFCLCHEHQGRHLVTAVNLSGQDVECQIDDPELSDLANVLADQEYPPAEKDPTKFVLAAHGYRWFRRSDEPFG